MGIETPQQLAVHPLRGSICENMAAVEMIKNRFNVGKKSDICFYRENGGREVDIVKSDGDKLDIFEIKSSKTYNSSFEKNLKYLQEMMGDKIRSAKVVYDGEPIPPRVINIRGL